MRADQVGAPYPSGFVKDPKEWFNTKAFAQPAPGNFGNYSRNVVRAPGVELFNLSAGKTFRLTERLQLQFRIESFNAFNHPQFDMPDPSVTDSTFGVITSAEPLDRIREPCACSSEGSVTDRRGHGRHSPRPLHPAGANVPNDSI